jgi:hypothetical protein
MSLEAEYRVPSGQIAIFPGIRTAVIATSLGDTLHFFQLDATATPARSFRQQFSALRALSGGGKHALAVLSADGSLTVWGVDGREPLFRVNHHFAPAVDVAVSENLGAIASLDSSGRVVIVEMWSGQFVRSLAIAKDAKRLLFVDEGFVSVLRDGPGDGRTTIEIFGIDGVLVGTHERIGLIKCWCCINRRDGPAMIAVGFVDGLIEMIAVPTGVVVTEMKIEGGACALAYDVHENLIFVADGMNQVRVSAVEC